jgi:hypothetical protein
MPCVNDHAPLPFEAFRQRAEQDAAVDRFDVVDRCFNAHGIGRQLVLDLQKGCI